MKSYAYYAHQPIQGSVWASLGLFGPVGPDLVDVFPDALLVVPGSSHRFPRGFKSGDCGGQSRCLSCQSVTSARVVILDCRDRNVMYPGKMISIGLWFHWTVPSTPEPISTQVKPTNCFHSGDHIRIINSLRHFPILPAQTHFRSSQLGRSGLACLWDGIYLFIYLYIYLFVCSSYLTVTPVLSQAQQSL